MGTPWTTTTGGEPPHDQPKRVRHRGHAREGRQAKLLESASADGSTGGAVTLPPVMGSLIKKRRKRMRKKKHRKMLKRTRAQRMRGK